MAAFSAAVKALLDHEVGEAYAHVQGESLKAYAALHVRLTNSPITRLGGVMAYSCPKCGSENVQKLSLAYGAGTAGISATTISTGLGRGHGGIGISATQGETQSLLAKRSAPPKAQSAAGPIGCLVVLGFAAAVGAGAAFNSAIAFFIVMGTAIALSVALARKVAAHNAEQLPKAKSLWDRRFICLRCEEIFEPQSAPAIGSAPLQSRSLDAPPVAPILKGEAPAASAMYSVRLLSGGSRPLAATKVVQDLLRLRILEAKQIVETAPQVIRSELSLSAAEGIKTRFEAIGATADIVGSQVSVGSTGEPAPFEEARQDQLNTESPTAMRRCSDCSRPIHGLDGRCSHCQTEQADDRPVPASLWAGIAFLLVAGAAIYVFSSKNAPTPTQALMPSAVQATASVPQPVLRARTLKVEVTLQAGLLGPLELSGTTNLPDGTLLPIWLEGDTPACTPNCGFEMGEAVVRNGHFQTTIKGKDPQPGRYTVHVTTAQASFQPPNVRAIFGPSGKNLHGPYIATLSDGGRRYFPVNPETEDAERYFSGFLVNYTQRIEIGEGGEVNVCPKHSSGDDCG